MTPPKRPAVLVPPTAAASPAVAGRASHAPSLAERYRAVRGLTERLAAPLSPEDCAIQSMPDASPTRWHLAHTTWFFETFVLARAEPGRSPFHPDFAHLFNSYYHSVGEPFPRAKRGSLSRPSLDEVRAYRAHVDGDIEALLERGDERLRRVESAIVLGLNHEQQHQELLLTDILHVFAQNPLAPAYAGTAPRIGGAPAAPLGWVAHEAGVREIGHAGAGFAYDNESPRHRVFVEPFALGTRLVTNGEFLAFLEDGGYRRHQHWLSLGWDRVKAEGWEAPLYWTKKDGRWWRFSLHGLLPLDPHEPVSHVSLFEADAYAAWAGARLPTEAEWEVASDGVPVAGNLLRLTPDEPSALRPRPSAARGDEPTQMFGDVWEWTSSAYAPYPGFKPWAGSLGEYNGKFMCNQYVLRGGSCATPADHVRRTYRNFFPPEARWQFSGIRLARSS
jgi:ergothioneine biosynthesis protein EgtB